MSMLGKISVGVRNAEATPKIMISTAMTMKVYGRRSASLTIPIMMGPLLGESCSARRDDKRRQKILFATDHGCRDDCQAISRSLSTLHCNEIKTHAIRRRPLASRDECHRLQRHRRCSVCIAN